LEILLWIYGNEREYRKVMEALHSICQGSGVFYLLGFEILLRIYGDEKEYCRVMEALHSTRQE
jgi:hypothetical protein